ncbi:vitelline membrane protein 15a-3-like [Pseudomyrmex gracilis]|uniref:vitelline membrane protein 15a-3-like n=1 Tax=Pseudomyrmex gracilis TaxID=219809 RepID=UPI0009957A41|nr:vitelline membrane protein 15a-3-like [Pseudomyrmex gracilis]
MKFFIVLFAVVAAASAGLIGYHEPEVHHAHFIPQQPAIPPPHPSPLHIKGHAHVSRIHYDAPHIPHPHLVGVEHYAPAPEPQIAVVKTGHGHGWD